MENPDMEVEIQCPDCFTTLILTETKEYYCKTCDRNFSESEIRKRSGI